MKYRHEYDMPAIGRNLRRLRESRLYSVEDIRRYLRMGSVQAIYKWEAGKSLPQADTLIALMELYHVGLGEILRGAKRREESSLSLRLGDERHDAAFAVRMGKYMLDIHKIKAAGE